jgi:tetratricopeptide (TPR) repeat protein
MQIRTIVLFLPLMLLIGCDSQSNRPKNGNADPNMSAGSIDGDSTLDTGAPTAYDRALQYAETGDSALLPLCDSLLKFDSARAGASPFYYRGIYHATRKEIKEAISFFDKTIVKDYRFLDAYIEKAALLAEIKKPAMALRELELARTISPSYAPTHYWIAKINESMGQTDKALLHYQLSLSLDSTLIEARQGIERLEK